MSTLGSSFEVRPIDLDGVKAYQLYNSIKLHFNSDKYDFTVSGIARNFTESSYQKRPDKKIFEKAARDFQYQSRYIPLLVSNFYLNRKLWVGGLLEENCIKNAVKFRKYMNDFSGSFYGEIRTLALKGNITTSTELYDSSKSNFFNLLIRDQISPLTASILNHLYYDKYMSNSPLSFVYDMKSKDLKKLYSFIPENKRSIAEAEIEIVIKDISV